MLQLFESFNFFTPPKKKTIYKSFDLLNFQFLSVAY